MAELEENQGELEHKGDSGYFSVGACFLTVLFIANEEGLSIESQPDCSGVKIRIN